MVTSVTVSNVPNLGLNSVISNIYVLLVVLKFRAPNVDVQVEIWLSTLQPNVNVVATASRHFIKVECPLGFLTR